MMITRRRTSLLLLITLLIPLFGMPHDSAAQSENDPNTPIEHFIVVMQQNHTFDNYFGTYPGANGIPDGVCIPISVSDPKNKQCLAPYDITNQPISDLSHSETIFHDQYQNGKMNGFVEALTKLNQDGQLSMGHFTE